MMQMGSPKKKQRKERPNDRPSPTDHGPLNNRQQHLPGRLSSSSSSSSFSFLRLRVSKSTALVIWLSMIIGHMGAWLCGRRMQGLGSINRHENEGSTTAAASFSSSLLPQVGNEHYRHPVVVQPTTTSLREPSDSQIVQEEEVVVGSQIHGPPRGELGHLARITMMENDDDDYYYYCSSYFSKSSTSQLLVTHMAVKNSLFVPPLSMPWPPSMQLGAGNSSAGGLLWEDHLALVDHDNSSSSSSNNNNNNNKKTTRTTILSPNLKTKTVERGITGTPTRHDDRHMEKCERLLLLREKEDCNEKDGPPAQHQAHTFCSPDDWPTGHHLLVDLPNVDPDFLNSEKRLAQALIQMVQAMPLRRAHDVNNNGTFVNPRSKVYSYQCHALLPTGVSCVALMFRGHATLHTWPDHGVVSVDVFLTASTPTPRQTTTTSTTRRSPTEASPPGTADHHDDDLLVVPRMLAAVETFMGVPPVSTALDDHSPPTMTWSFKSRGFAETLDWGADTHNSKHLHSNYHDFDPMDLDLQWLLQSRHLHKTHVASVQSPFQRIDIWDFQDQSHSSAQKSTGSLDRVVFLDDVMQSRRYGEAAYHEALVHPAMFAHEWPRRVAIIGGGEGATLREVFKHATVEQVVMVEIDQVMINTSRQFSPEWSDCSFLLTSSHKSMDAFSCFDDPRLHLYAEDAVAWFIERFNADDGRANESINKIEPFDIIIMDALDPTASIPFSAMLYANPNFTQSIAGALGESGIFIAQIGETPYINDVPEYYDPESLTAEFIRGLENAGFESIVRYEETHGRFTAPWSFLLAMKDITTRSDWFANEAEVALAMRERCVSTASMKELFRFFDGATMMSYQFPSRVIEESWCKNNHPVCRGHGFDPDVPLAPVSSFHVKPSSVPGAGRGIVAGKDIPRGAYIGLDECVHGLLVPTTTYSLIRAGAEDLGLEYWECLADGYIDGYGWQDYFYGESSAGVDPGILTFMNHGCNGTYNTGTYLPYTELTALDDYQSLDIYDDEGDVYDPYSERHYPLWGCGDTMALSDIAKGQEILDNYLVYGGGQAGTGWNDNLRELCGICSGEQQGIVSMYEVKKQQSVYSPEMSYA